MGYFEQVNEAAEFVRTRAGALPTAAVVLGSGLGDFASGLADAVSIPYTRHSALAGSRVIGHEGRLVVGDVAGRRVAALVGSRPFLRRARHAHGHVRRARARRCSAFRALLLTNAAGGINTSFEQGALMLMTDHINLMGSNPLVGPNDDRFGARFPDMSEVYSARLRYARARRGAAATASRSSRASTSPSTARATRRRPRSARSARSAPTRSACRPCPRRSSRGTWGIEVLGISCITNMAAGVLPKPLVHDEVMEVGARVRSQFIALLTAIIASSWKLREVDRDRDMATEQELVDAARAARERAIAPFSGFTVGAAFETADGTSSPAATSRTPPTG